MNIKNIFRFVGTIAELEQAIIPAYERRKKQTKEPKK